MTMVKVIGVLAFSLASVLAILSAASARRAEQEAPPIGAFVNVDGARVHFVEAGVEHKGDGPSIILIHGASANLRDMKLALGDRLAERHHVVIVDRPGHGYTTRPQSGYELARQARVIRDAASAIGAEDPIVVGQSLGGAVSLAYALQFQQEMSGVVLLAAVSHEWPGGIALRNSASETPILGFLLRRLFVPVYGRIVGPGAVAAAFAPDAAPDRYYERVGVPLLFRPAQFRANAEDIFHLKREIIGMQNRYDELDLPVTIVTGTEDRDVSPEIHSKTLAKEVDGAGLHLLADTGHSLHHAESEKIIALIEAMREDAMRFSAKIDASAPQAAK